MVSASITYLRPPALAPATVRTTLLRRGRTAAHVRAVLAQGGDDLVDAVLVLGDLPDEPAVRYDGTPAFHAPDPDDCIRLTPKIPTGVHVGILDVLDQRLDPATVPFAASPPPAGTPAELRGWTRFADGREPDPLSLLFFVDAIPPATLMIGSTGWVPTLQMSAYVRARPAPGWLGIRMTAGLVADGMVDETCVLWDSRGHLVAQSTQLARLRFPDERSGGLLGVVLVGILLVVGVVAIPRAVALGPRRHRVEPATRAQLRRHDGALFRCVDRLHGRSLPNSCRCPNAKEPLPWWEAAPRRQDW